MSLLIALKSFLGFDLTKSPSSKLYLFIGCLSLSTYRSATKLKTTIVNIYSTVNTSHVLSHKVTYYIPIETQAYTSQVLKSVRLPTWCIDELMVARIGK